MRLLNTIWEYTCAVIEGIFFWMLGMGCLGLFLWFAGFGLLIIFPPVGIVMLIIVVLYSIGSLIMNIEKGIENNVSK